MFPHLLTLSTFGSGGVNERARSSHLGWQADGRSVQRGMRKLSFSRRRMWRVYHTRIVVAAAVRGHPFRSVHEGLTGQRNLWKCERSLKYSWMPVEQTRLQRLKAFHCGKTLTVHLFYLQNIWVTFQRVYKWLTVFIYCFRYSFKNFNRWLKFIWFRIVTL